jgi:N-acetylglucosamine kinase-like BadF-type ATPase
MLNDVYGSAAPYKSRFDDMQGDQMCQIEAELQTYEVELFNASTEYRQLAQDAARKRATYDVQYAQEFLKVKTGGDKVTDKLAESVTVVAVQGSLTACRIAESLADASKRHLTTLQTLVSSCQTRAGLLKTERSLTGYQT